MLKNKSENTKLNRNRYVIDYCGPSFITVYHLDDERVWSVVPITTYIDGNGEDVDLTKRPLRDVRQIVCGPMPSGGYVTIAPWDKFHVH